MAEAPKLPSGQHILECDIDLTADYRKIRAKRVVEQIVELIDKQVVKAIAENVMEVIV